MTIEKVAVIGAGLMGSGIAAQVANAGLDVVLLDIVPKDADDRSVLAKSAIEKMLKTDPAPFMSKKNAKLITPGNIEDDAKLLKDCDWIIEVVLEDLGVKHKTYDMIAKNRKKGAIVSSNTSTIPLENLVEKADKEFKEHFVVTHFFNPPRYMRLLELVVGKNTKKDVIKTVRDFCDQKLGKGVVVCHDTPGFIANRLGVFWLQAGLNEMMNQNVPIEVADAVMAKPVGIPKTGIFGLIDLVGIDLMPHLAKSMLDTLPKKDAYRDIYQDYPFIHDMIKGGYTGRKGKGGFYRLDPDVPKGERVKQALQVDPKKWVESQYEKADKPRLESVSAGRKGLRAVVETDDAGGRYAWAVLKQVLHYAASLVPEIADNIHDVDQGMKLGYNWKKGPFEMMDDLGPAWFAAKLKEEGMEVPKLLADVGEGSFYQVDDGQLQYFGTDGKYHKLERGDGVLLLSDIKLTRDPVIKTASASVWDINDGVLCLEFTGKMNALDTEVFTAIHKAIGMIGDGSGDYKALVVYNEGSHFSAGANLGLAIFAINIALWPQIEELVSGGQQAYKALKFAPFPVVSAPSGMALGGGCEILLHSDHVQAHAETYCGLVEVGVGLIPGWGGCKEMILRFREREMARIQSAWGFPKVATPMGAIMESFQTIGMANVAKSADQAKEIGYFRDRDGITMNRDRLLFDAKAKALEMSKDYQAPEMVEDIRLPGPTAKTALDMAVGDLNKSGKATDYDVVVSDALASVLSGGKNADWTEPMSEDDILRLEVKEFMALVRKEGTYDRVQHMLTTGKPLRN